MQKNAHPRYSVYVGLLIAAGVASSMAGCRPESAASNDFVTGSIDRPAVAVVRQPKTLSVSLLPHVYGMTPKQQVDVMRFLERYRANGSDSGQLTLSVPVGGATEPSAIEAASQIRQLLRHVGIAHGAIRIDQHRAHGRAAQIRLAYQEVVLDIPDCGYWPDNVARDHQNIPPANIGCAVERNSAVMIARPADLVGPRGMDPRASERRDEVWDKYIRGQSTVAEKQGAEKLKE
jgi:pilus assembly protein CpaD